MKNGTIFLRKIYFSLNKYLLEHNAMISIYILRRNSTILSIYIHTYISEMFALLSLCTTANTSCMCVCVFVYVHKESSDVEFLLMVEISPHFLCLRFSKQFFLTNCMFVCGCVGVCVYECVSVNCLRYIRTIYIAVKMPDHNVQNAKETPHMFDKHCLCILCLIVFDSRVNNCRFCRYFAV